MLEYGSLRVFFGGLEGLVGSPNPKVMAAMDEEHSARSDSTRDFTTSNYDLRTTSAVEWAFVATPDAPPDGGWPVEEKIRAALDGGEGADLEAIRASGAQPEPGILTYHAYLPLATYHRPPITFSPHLPPTTAYSFSPRFVMVRCRAAPAAADSRAGGVDGGTGEWQAARAR